MDLLWNILRFVIAAGIIVTVAGISKGSPRLGASLLSLPVVSILAFIFSWFEHHDMQAISRMARETLVLVPLSLPFFIPLALAERLGWNFWICMAVGAGLASASILTWLAITTSR